MADVDSYFGTYSEIGSRDHGDWSSAQGIRGVPLLPSPRDYTTTDQIVVVFL